MHPIIIFSLLAGLVFKWFLNLNNINDLSRDFYTWETQGGWTISPDIFNHVYNHVYLSKDKKIDSFDEFDEFDEFDKIPEEMSTADIQVGKRLQVKLMKAMEKIIRYKIKKASGNWQPNFTFAVQTYCFSILYWFLVGE